MNIENTLQERGTRYGVFEDHARITQNIKRAMANSPNWNGLADDQRECLEMIAHKVGRILNGDPNYHDSWHDIMGYTKLVADRLAVVTETFGPLDELLTTEEKAALLSEPYYVASPDDIQITMTGESVRPSVNLGEPLYQPGAKDIKQFVSDDPVALKSTARVTINSIGEPCQVVDDMRYEDVLQRDQKELWSEDEEERAGIIAHNGNDGDHYVFGGDSSHDWSVISAVMLEGRGDDAEATRKVIDVERIINRFVGSWVEEKFKNTGIGVPFGVAKRELFDCGMVFYYERGTKSIANYRRIYEGTEESVFYPEVTYDVEIRDTNGITVAYCCQDSDVVGV